MSTSERQQPDRMENLPRSAMANRSREEIRENARWVLQQSGCAEMLRTLNRTHLKGRAWFDEYDSGVIMKWGTGYTRRHIWVHVDGDQLMFRLKQHRRCKSTTFLCDGEYHRFTPELWANRVALLEELRRNYEHPVAESSED
jgi:hypothetical protein